MIERAAVEIIIAKIDRSQSHVEHEMLCEQGIEPLLTKADYHVDCAGISRPIVLFWRKPIAAPKNLFILPISMSRDGGRF